MRILGIDPGTAIVGWGIVDYDKNNLKLIDYGTILTSKDLEMSERLGIIYDSLNLIIEKYNPNLAAIEELFFNNNAKTIISVGQARGVILLSFSKYKIKFGEYTPLQVKNSISGYGRAYKLQVQNMVKLILKLKEIPKPDDAADAIAIAITHAYSYKLIK